jgi:hypothetical protein
LCDTPSRTTPGLAPSEILNRRPSGPSPATVGLFALSLPARDDAPGRGMIPNEPGCYGACLAALGLRPGPWHLTC